MAQLCTICFIILRTKSSFDAPLPTVYTFTNKLSVSALPRTATCQFRANKQKSELLVKADQIDANKVKSSLVQEASKKERERENMKFDLSEIEY